MANIKAPRLRRRGGKRRYLSGDLLKVLGIMLTVDGTVGAALLAHSMQQGLSQLEMLSIMQNNPGQASLAAWAMVLQGMSYLAWPVYAFLAVKGVENTSDFGKYALRLLITAVVSEVPYDLAVHGRWMDWSGQNFLFSLFIGVVMLYLIRRAEEQKGNAGGIWGVAVLGGILWSYLLKTQLGIWVVLGMAVMYLFRNRELWRNISMAVLGLATIPASLSVFLLHWYNDTPSGLPKWLYYGFYPVHLLLIGLAFKYWIG